MGQMATDGGHSSLEEVLATLSVPSLTKRIFTEIERCLGTTFEQLLLELMLKTGSLLSPQPQACTGGMFTDYVGNKRFNW